MTQLAQESLESKSLWYKYKTAVWLQESAEETVVHNVMRVLRAIRNFNDLAYVSVPVTSGRYLYELQLANPLMSRDGLIKKAIDHNYHEGWAFVEELRGRLACPIIYPADLVPVHQRWEQAHFQALWLSIIAEKCTEVHMSEGWEYSNGGSEEFTHTMQLKLGLPRHGDLLFWNTKESEEIERERMRNIEVYDHGGSPLTISDGVEALERSSFWLRERGFEAKTLENCLQLLHWTKEMLDEEFYQ